MSREKRDQRAENDASQMRRTMEWLLRKADMAEAVEHNIEHPIWKKVIEPVVDQEIAIFKASCMDPELTGEKFKQQQAAAVFAESLKSFVGGLDGEGKVKELRDQATKILRSLEEAEERGLIRKREPEGALNETG